MTGSDCNSSVCNRVQANVQCLCLKIVIICLTSKNQVDFLWWNRPRSIYSEKDSDEHEVEASRYEQEENRC